MERWQSMRFEMQGFCRKYYPAGVEIFGKRPQALDLATQRRPRPSALIIFAVVFKKP
jgi:hypothetical protein